MENSVFISRKSNIVKGGTDVVLNALAAYLRYLEGTARDDWQEYVDKGLFGDLLLLNSLYLANIYFCFNFFMFEKQPFSCP